MHARTSFFVTACLTLVAAVAAAQTFPSPTGRISDFAQVIDAQTEAQIDRDLDQLEQQTSSEIAVATVTSTMLLGTSVLVAPYRGPLNDARQLTTVDVLSGGRLVLAKIDSDAEQRLASFEECDVAVDERLRLDSLFGGAGGDIDRELIGTGEESDLIADHAVPARNRIGGHHLVQGMEARFVVRVGDGGGEVVAHRRSIACSIAAQRRRYVRGTAR